MTKNQAQVVYPVGAEIVWPHPADGRPVVVKVVSYDVSASDRKVEVVNVEGADFNDGVSVGRLEADGSGLI